MKTVASETPAAWGVTKAATATPGPPPTGTVGERLSEVLPGRVSLGVTDRLKMAHDASHYLLTPEVLVRPTTTEQVQTVLRWATAHRVPVVPQGGLTGLAGGAVPCSDANQVTRTVAAATATGANPAFTPLSSSVNATSSHTGPPASRSSWSTAVMSP